MKSMANGHTSDEEPTDDLICTTLDNGVKIPRLGMWDHISKSPFRDIEKALQSGYRHIIVSHNPGKDTEIGDIVSRWIHQDKFGSCRDQLFISLILELGPTAGFGNVKQQICTRIETLGCQYIDMIILHRPDSHKIGDSLRQKNIVSKIWKSLENMVSDGMLRSLSVSNFHRDEMESILSTSSQQPHIIWLSSEPKTYGWVDLDHAIRYCQYKSITLGLLHCIDRPDTQWVRNRSKSLATISKKHNKTAIQVFHRLLLQKNIIVAAAIDNRTIESSFRVYDFHLPQEDVKSLQNITL